MRPDARAPRPAPSAASPEDAPQRAERHGYTAPRKQFPGQNMDIMSHAAQKAAARSFDRLAARMITAPARRVLRKRRERRLSSGPGALNPRGGLARSCPGRRWGWRLRRSRDRPPRPRRRPLRAGRAADPAGEPRQRRQDPPGHPLRQGPVAADRPGDDPRSVDVHGLPGALDRRRPGQSAPLDTVHLCGAPGHDGRPRPPEAPFRHLLRPLRRDAGGVGTALPRPRRARALS